VTSTNALICSFISSGEFVSIYWVPAARKWWILTQCGDWWYWLGRNVRSGIRSLGTAPTDSLLLSISWHWWVDPGRTASYLNGWVETLTSHRGSLLVILYIAAGKARQVPMPIWVLRIPPENWYYLEYNLEISRTFGIWIGVHKLFLCHCLTLWSGASHLNFLSLSFPIRKMGIINTHATELL